MKKARTTTSTLVGKVHPEVLSFTAGKDALLDHVLIEPDCIGTAAHVTMLSGLRGVPTLLSKAEAGKIIRELVKIMRRSRSGKFKITLRDQDVHLAVERALSTALGPTGRKVHTARSRNDQVAVDLRLYAREQILCAVTETTALADALLSFARRNAAVPMVGRTHMQPAMPSSVGVWASAHAESLLDDVSLLRSAYAYCGKSPLGSAAGYGVPMVVDRERTARLLGFDCAHWNVLAAANARGKTESVVLASMAQVMLSLSRLAGDLVVYCAPEFGYFVLPSGFCTGSSIMPQKANPDVPELVRARASTVAACAVAVNGIVVGLPSGYNRDLQETKEPFLNGLSTARACLRVTAPLVSGLRARKKALRAGFTPEVFAADAALRLVAGGVPFRDAYRQVKDNPPGAADASPDEAVASRSVPGGACSPDLDTMKSVSRDASRFARKERNRYHASVSRLLGVRYPELT
ncbi:MAG: argininosuccinate lyase [Lentisphaerae bacterium]|nr:argininosuccinate lyase [Lentisphaerota bacterium]